MQRRSMAIALLAAAPILSTGPVDAAEEVGRFAVVQNDVRSLKPDATEPVPAVAGAAVALDETETTGEASAAKLIFGEGAVISLGQNTSFRVTPAAVQEAKGESASVLDVLAGKVRIFVSRFWSDRPELEVRTPTAVVGVKGSEVGVEVLPDGETLVSVFSGTASVRPLAGTAIPRTVQAGQQSRVTTLGAAPQPGPAPPGALAALRRATEPTPIAPRGPLGNVPVRDAPQVVGVSGMGQRTAVNTTAASSRGELWSDPATSARPSGGDSRAQGLETAGASEAPQGSAR